MKLLLTTLLLSVTFLIFAQHPNENPELVKKVNTEWLSCMQRKDTAAASLLLSDDIIFINSQGTALTKKDILSTMADPKRKYKSIKVDEIQTTKIFDNTAFIIEKTTTIRILNDVQSTLRMSVMIFFEKRKGKWLIAAMHNTLLDVK
jgi:uncharacterized protein (TIGR02246 family)